MGLIHRIGDGRTSEIWHDNWIQGTSTMKPICRLADDPVHLVSDLMEERGAWNGTLVRRMFIASDANVILSLPRPRVPMEDFWVWGWERTGVFTARSAYRNIMEK